MTTTNTVMSPPYPYAAVQRRTNGLAVASLVLGILWIWWVGSILALVFGVVALQQIDESHGTQAGRGMAIAGVVLGWLGFVAAMAFGLIGILLSAAPI